MSKMANDKLRNEWTEIVKAFLADKGEDVLQTATNVIAIPVVDSEGEDNYIEITIKVPVGSRDGDAYDAYERAQEFAMKQKEKAEKAAKDAEKKAAKIAREEAMSQQKAEAKKKREEQ